MNVDQLKPDFIVKGPLFSEPVHIIVAKLLDKSIMNEGSELFSRIIIINKQGLCCSCNDQNRLLKQ